MEKKKNNTMYNSDITENDKQALGEKIEHLRSDEGRDAFLKNREKPVDFAGKELDVPGRTLPKDAKMKLTDE
ncbi:hypothetical protein [Aquimarina sp. SS2-1]|uniref:hypothetical protein n=1 Tax=Aquimarina besae TaxID=3342247 RepID=UPI003672C331